MEKFRVAVVENEDPIRQQMVQALTDVSHRTKVLLEVDEYSSGEAFTAALKDNLYAIAFLDIYMDEMTGIEAAAILRKEDPQCLVVFCTTSETDMLSAFQLHAFDYILKPITDEAVERVMGDALKILNAAGNYIEIKAVDGDQSLMVNSIMCVTVSGHYLLFRVLGGREYKTRMKISEAMNLLSDYRNFLEINRGILVNMDYIDDMSAKGCRLKDGTDLPVRTKGTQQVIQSWNDYCFKRLREESHRRSFNH